MPMSRKTTACVTTLLFALAMPPALANRYTIEDLGANVVPFDINRSGIVVGSRNDKAADFRNGHWHALQVPGQPGIASGVNDHGDMVGSQGSMPILWSRFDHRQVLALPPDALTGSATGIANDGTAVGRFNPADDLLHAHCFRTLPDATAIDLGLLAQGGSCIASGINELGEIVGAADVLPSGPMHAFLWREGVLSDLGTLGGDTSSASAVNGHGQVVGRSNLIIDGPGHAFVWKQGVMKDIGASADFPDTVANGINDRGDIVGGGTRVQDGSLHALRFASGSVIPLEDEVQQLGDWLLTSATSINGDGVIVGQGVRRSDGREHAFLLRPLP